MATIDTVMALKHIVQQWTRGWMMSARTDAVAIELGLRSGRQMWIVGRAGAMGDIDADVAAGGLMFLAPGEVREQWNDLPADVSPSRVAAVYAALVHEWGNGELPRFGNDQLNRLHELGRRIIDAAPASLGLVFAGWRALPHGDTLAAQAAMTMQVHRELRGAAHIVAVTAVGLSPVEAVLASPAPPPRSGPEWAEHLGWSGPFADRAALVERRNAAEQLTNEILVPFYDALSDSELQEFAELATSIRNAIDM